MSTMPGDAEKLLAVAPDRFVAERKRLVDELRKSGRDEDAASVAAMRKPSAVVLAVNRAARDRPKAARAAADAAQKARKAQAGADQAALRRALDELDGSLELLSEVALAHAGSSGRGPSEAMRRRLQDVLRNAVARDETRDALGRGVLVDEPEAAGFESLAGLSIKPTRAASARPSDPKRKRDTAPRRDERALREELAKAEKALKDAERAERTAVAERERAEKKLAAIRSKLERPA